MNWILIGSTLAGLGVAAGAFGAHALADQVSARQLEVFQTGVLYQLIHALGIIAYRLFRGSHVPHDSSLKMSPAWAFLIGVALFSGSLYLYAITGIRQFGMVTPFGGVSFLIGWVLFARHARFFSKSANE